MKELEDLGVRRVLLSGMPLTYNMPLARFIVRWGMCFLLGEQFYRSTIEGISELVCGHSREAIEFTKESCPRLKVAFFDEASSLTQHGAGGVGGGFWKDSWHPSCQGHAMLAKDAGACLKSLL
eukprot:CAMPEP_0197865714 /NCGR_PEP_ID=MMETSP1438-20131217/43820_1 /TAXON_ID=1461541 /ORGANISM="Pterosperma sp., Strain CCMP1384" /LENGTH=122 /DNA_ID=CAMNT_0043484211 /DNA_START=608 /DNA_END=979 /DNA_ORIENTATION=+